MAQVYLNGRYIDETLATVSVSDRGFLYGHGLFETLVAYRAKIFRLDRHLRRLFASADALDLAPMPPAGEIGGVLGELIERNGLSDAYLRLTVTAGCAVGMAPSGRSEPTVLAVARELKRYPRDMYERGAAVITTQCRLGHLSAHKTLGYFPNILARMQAVGAGADEGLMRDGMGLPAEGSACNIFAVVAGAVITPPISAGVLPGVTRAEALDIAREEGISTEERNLTEDDLRSADEMFLTNTIMGVMPVGRLDGRDFPTSRPLTLKLRVTYAARAGDAPTSSGL